MTKIGKPDTLLLSGTIRNLKVENITAEVFFRMGDREDMAATGALAAAVGLETQGNMSINLLRHATYTGMEWFGKELRCEQNGIARIHFEKNTPQINTPQTVMLARQHAAQTRATIQTARRRPERSAGSSALMR